MNTPSGRTPDADAARRETDDLRARLDADERAALARLADAAKPDTAPPRRLDADRRAKLLATLRTPAGAAPTLERDETVTAETHPRVIRFTRAFRVFSREYGFAQVAAMLVVMVFLAALSLASFRTTYVGEPKGIRADADVFATVFAAGGAASGEKAKAFESRDTADALADAREASPPTLEPRGDIAPQTEGFVSAKSEDRIMSDKMDANPAPSFSTGLTTGGLAKGSGGGTGGGEGIGFGRAARQPTGHIVSKNINAAEPLTPNTPVTEQPAAPSAPAKRQAAIDGLSVRAKVDFDSEYVFHGKESTHKDVSSKITQNHEFTPSFTTLDEAGIKSANQVLTRNEAESASLPTSIESRHAARVKIPAPVDSAWSLPPDFYAKSKAAPVSREVSSAQNAFSTFSLNVSDASFRMAVAANSLGRIPAPATQRAEEFVNAQLYRDPQPRAGEAFSFRSENAAHPFAPNRQLVRVSVRAAAEGRAAATPLNLVVALDNSGSMERADRLETTRAALTTLADKLGPHDRVSVLGFARTQNLLVDREAGPAAAAALRRIAATHGTPEGGTNLEGALTAAYAQLAAQSTPGAANRVILLTDGATNLGEGEPEKLAALVETNRKAGNALDCFGIGLDGYDDAMLERLARHGDGRYAFLNDAESVKDGFAEKIAGALRPAARDVKVQVEFNPDRVASWRLIGYDKHRLTKEQFRDNTVDAAELAAAETGTAVYVVEPRADGRGDLGVARVRYLDPASGEYREESRTLPFRDAPAFDDAPRGVRLAAVAALTGELYGDAPEAATYDPAALAKAARRLAVETPGDTRIQNLRELAEAAARNKR